MQIYPIGLIFDGIRPVQFAWTLDELGKQIGELLEEGSISVEYAEVLMHHAESAGTAQNLARLYENISRESAKFKRCELLTLTQDETGWWVTWRDHRFFACLTVLDTYARLQAMCIKEVIVIDMAVQILGQLIKTGLPWDEHIPSPIPITETRTETPVTPAPLSARNFESDPMAGLRVVTRVETPAVSTTSPTRQVFRPDAPSNGCSTLFSTPPPGQRSSVTELSPTRPTPPPRSAQGIGQAGT